MNFSFSHNPNDYHVLTPTSLGDFYRSSEPCYVVRLEAPAPSPPGPIPHGRREQERYWKSLQHPRMTLDVPKQHMERFALSSDFEYKLPVKITKSYDFQSIAEWINTQTKQGKWSMQIYADKDNRPGHSILLFLFEDQGDAAIFKLFNL